MLRWRVWWHWNQAYDPEDCRLALDPSSSAVDPCDAPGGYGTCTPQAAGNTEQATRGTTAARGHDAHTPAACPAAAVLFMHPLCSNNQKIDMMKRAGFWFLDDGKLCRQLPSSRCCCIALLISKHATTAAPVACTFLCLPSQQACRMLMAPMPAAPTPAWQLPMTRAHVFLSCIAECMLRNGSTLKVQPVPAGEPTLLPVPLPACTPRQWRLPET